MTPRTTLKILEEPLAARQDRWLNKEILERDGKDDQRNAAGAGERPLEDGVRCLCEQSALAEIISPSRAARVSS